MKCRCQACNLRKVADRLIVRMQILAYVNKVKDIGSNVDHSTFTMEDVESNIVRCPDQVAAKSMIDGEIAERMVRIPICTLGAQARYSFIANLCIIIHSAINEVRVKGDSCGGEVTCIVRNCPKGLGVPVFDKLEAELAKAMMSLPASKVGVNSRTRQSATNML